MSDEVIKLNSAIQTMLARVFRGPPVRPSLVLRFF